MFVQNFTNTDWDREEGGGEPGEPKLCTTSLMDKANWVNKAICSPYYRVLVRQDVAEQNEAWIEMQKGLAEFTTDLPDDETFFDSASEPTIVDVALIPWAVRLSVLIADCPVRRKGSDKP